MNSLSKKIFFNGKNKLIPKYFFIINSNKNQPFNNKYSKYNKYNNSNVTTISRIFSSTQTQTSLKGWRKYAQQFRSKPASYLFSFAILHEITAVIPIPIIYFVLDITGLQVPFPQQVLDEGNKFINRVVTYY